MNETKTILFVDDDVQLVEALATQARSLGMEVFTAHNALTALNIVERQSLDLICLDVEMPTADGLSIGEMLSNTAMAGNAVILVLTGRKDQETRQRCQQLGAHYLAKGNDTWPRLRTLLAELIGLECDVEENEAEPSLALTELVFEMLGASESFLDSEDASDDTISLQDNSKLEPWVLCVEDDQDFSLALQMRLKQHGISAIRAFDGVGGIQTAMTRPAEAIILDYNLPNGRGDYVLRRLKANPVTRDIPVIVVSGQKRPGLEKEMLHLGAAKFFAKPVQFNALLEELHRHVPVNA